jgi:hypothetical protein
LALSGSFLSKSFLIKLIELGKHAAAELGLGPALLEFAHGFVYIL